MPAKPAAWHADSNVPSSGRNAESTYMGMRGTAPAARGRSSERTGPSRRSPRRPRVVGTAGAPPPEGCGTGTPSRRRAGTPPSPRATPRGADGTPGRRPSPRAAALGRERLHHLGRPLQHAARIVIGDRSPRLLQRIPGAVGDPLFRLRHRVAAARLEQKEVTVLVYRLAAKPEVPVDHLDRAVQDQGVEAGLLDHLAARRLGRRLAPLEVALGKAPVLVRVPDQQKPWRAAPPAPAGGAARAGLTRGPALAERSN